MERALRRGHQIIEREIAVRDRVERIGGRPVEAERQRGRLAVDRKAGAGQRGGAERAFVEPRAGVGEARAVAAQHLVIGHQMVAERHRLGGSGDG